MSVYIKGMEMPEGCGECPLAEGRAMMGELVLICRINGNKYSKLHGVCPLIPVPAHGRLIDADALTEKIKRHREYHSDGSASGAYISNGIGQCLDIINGKESPTIIPASKEGET